MFVSVIIPNYNHAAFLRKRIDSVLSQTHQDFELILLDDRSTDNSSEVISSYRNHPKVSAIVLNEQNSGSTFIQWQKGIALAKADWIWLAESDDFCSPHFLEKVLSKITLEVVVSYSQSNEVNARDEVKRSLSWYTDDLSTEHWQHDFNVKGSEEITNYLVYKNTIPNASAVVFNKAAYLAADPFFQTMKMCGDWFLWVQLLKKGNLAFTAEPLNFFRTHDATTRNLDTNSKQQRKLEEAYLVVHNILTTTSSEKKSIVAKRVSDIVKTYLLYFTTKQLLQLPLKPAAYSKVIPPQTLISTTANLLFNKIYHKVFFPKRAFHQGLPIEQTN